jgi:hypothetical protein
MMSECPSATERSTLQYMPNAPSNTFSDGYYDKSPKNTGPTRKSYDCNTVGKQDEASEVAGSYGIPSTSDQIQVFEIPGSKHSERCRIGHDTPNFLLIGTNAAQYKPNPKLRTRSKYSHHEKLEFKRRKRVHEEPENYKISLVPDLVPVQPMITASKHTDGNDEDAFLDKSPRLRYTESDSSSDLAEAVSTADYKICDHVQQNASHTDNNAVQKSKKVVDEQSSTEPSFSIPNSFVPGSSDDQINAEYRAPTEFDFQYQYNFDDADTDELFVRFIDQIPWEEDLMTDQ